MGRGIGQPWVLLALCSLATAVSPWEPCDLQCKFNYNYNDLDESYLIPICKNGCDFFNNALVSPVPVFPKTELSTMISENTVRNEDIFSSLRKGFFQDFENEDNRFQFPKELKTDFKNPFDPFLKIVMDPPKKIKENEFTHPKVLKTKTTENTKSPTDEQLKSMNQPEIKDKTTSHQLHKRDLVNPSLYMPDLLKIVIDPHQNKITKTYNVNPEILEVVKSSKVKNFAGKDAQKEKQDQAIHGKSKNKQTKTEENAEAVSTKSKTEIKDGKLLTIDTEDTGNVDKIFVKYVMDPKKKILNIPKTSKNKPGDKTHKPAPAKPMKIVVVTEEKMRQNKLKAKEIKSKDKKLNSKITKTPVLKNEETRSEITEVPKSPNLERPLMFTQTKDTKHISKHSPVHKFPQNIFKIEPLEITDSGILNIESIDKSSEMNERLELAKHACRFECARTYTKEKEKEACLVGCNLQAVSASLKPNQEIDASDPWNVFSKFQNNFLGLAGEISRMFRMAWSSINSRFHNNHVASDMENFTNRSPQPIKISFHSSTFVQKAVDIPSKYDVSKERNRLKEILKQSFFIPKINEPQMYHPPRTNNPKVVILKNMIPLSTIHKHKNRVKEQDSDPTLKEILDSKDEWDKHFKGFEFPDIELEDIKLDREIAAAAERTNLLDCISLKSGLPPWLFAFMICISGIIVLYLCVSLSTSSDDLKVVKQNSPVLQILTDDEDEFENLHKKLLPDVEDHFKIHVANA